MFVLTFLCLLAAALIAGWWFWRTYPTRVEQLLTRWNVPGYAMVEEDLVASGVIEASTVKVSSETGGRIVELLAGEGDVVAEGQALVRLDPAMLEARIAQVEASLRVAEAQWSSAQARARGEEWRRVRAAVALAEARVDAARRGWSDARILLAHPQELDIEIISARGEVNIAEHELAAARAEAQAADLEMEYWGRTTQILESGIDIELPTPGGTNTFHIDAGGDKVDAANLQWNLASQRAWVAHEAEQEAGVTLRSARTALDHLLTQRDDPQKLQAQADAAETALSMAQAALREARSALTALEEGASDEQIDLARAGADQAQAALEALLVRRDQLQLRAPRAGTILTCPAREGELARPGSTLLEIGDLDEVVVTVYVPEDELGEIWLGQGADVQVDSFPERAFRGVVTRIADEAEFTPRDVATQRDRVALVFAVEIRLANPDHALKPGMPADASFGEGPVAEEAGA